MHTVSELFSTSFPSHCLLALRRHHFVLNERPAACQLLWAKMIENSLPLVPLVIRITPTKQQNKSTETHTVKATTTIRAAHH